jgi:putative RecB family exonuclease
VTSKNYIKPLDFSYSRMGMYKECPQRFKFRYVDRIPEKPKHYFAFGHAIHSALEYLYNVSEPPFPSLDDLIKRYKANWESSTYEEKGYPSKAKEDAAFLEGVRMLEAYHKKHYPSLEIPLAVEFRTTVTIDNLKIIGIIDRIDYLGLGRVGIVDYKTGKTISREPDQLMMYQKVLENSSALKELVGQKEGSLFNDTKVEKLTFSHVPSLKEDSHVRYSDTKISKFWDGVLSVAEDIRSEKFKPLPEERKCTFCDYKNICPIFTGKGQSFSAVSEKSSGGSLTFKEKVDKYGQLCDSISDLTFERDKLKREIIKEMKGKKLDTLEGDKYQIKLNKSTQCEFSEKDKVIQLLKELGLIKKTLVPTHSTVLKLLDDPEVSESDREKLKILARVKEVLELECSPKNE